MKIIKLNKMVKSGAVTYLPMVRYLVTDMELMGLYNRYGKVVDFNVSSFNSYERHYRGENLDGKRLCLFRYSSWGDQLIVSSVVKYLKYLYPFSVIDVYCSSEVVSVWEENCFVNSVCILPMVFEGVMSYDYHIIFEGLFESNSELDQKNCYDMQFSFCGFDDSEISSNFKVPCIGCSKRWYRWVDDMCIDLVNQRYIIYQLNSANPVRCYPFDEGFKFLDLFLGEFKDYSVFIVGQLSNEHYNSRKSEYYSLLGKLVSKYGERVYNFVDYLSDFMYLVPLVENARCVVCPDSSVGHLSAVFSYVPVVSLWGAFPPELRVKYYSNHFPLVGGDVMGGERGKRCPCLTHNFSLDYCCDNGSGYCKSIASITGEMVFLKVKEVIR